MADSFELTSSKLDEKEKERLERKARIAELESKVVSFSTKAEKLEYIADRIEQYSRRKSIIIYGLPEEKRENTDSLVIETVKRKWVSISRFLILTEPIEMVPLLNS